nr:variant surface glycoprotein 1295 [Trypanosoma brucei]
MTRKKWSAAQVLLSVALINVITKAAEPAAGQAMKKVAWGILCDIAKDLDQAPSNVADVFTSRLAPTAQLEKLQGQLALYRAVHQAATPGPQERVYAAFLAIKLAKATPEKAAVIQAVRAANHLGFFHGAVSEWLTVAASTSTSVSTGCLATTAENTALQLAGLKGGEHSCKIEPPAITGTFNKLNKINDQGIQTGPAKSTVATADTTTDGGCAYTQHGANGLAGGTDTAHDIPFAGGYFYVSASDVKSNTWDILNAGTNAAHIKAWEAAKQFKDRETAANYTKITDLKQDSDFRSAAIAIIYGDQDSSQLDSKLKDLFGDSEDSFEEKFWKKVRETKIDGSKFGEKDATSIQGLEDPIKLTKAIYYYANQAAEKIKTLEKEAGKAQQLPKTTEELCNAKKDDDKACNQTKGCHYDASKTEGPKCTLKPKVQAQLEKANQ